MGKKKHREGAGGVAEDNIRTGGGPSANGLGRLKKRKDRPLADYLKKSLRDPPKKPEKRNQGSRRASKVFEKNSKEFAKSAQWNAKNPGWGAVGPRGRQHPGRNIPLKK